MKGKAFSAEMRLKKWPDQPLSADIAMPGFHGEDERGFSLFRLGPDHAVWRFSFTGAQGSKRRLTLPSYATTSAAMSRGRIQWEVNDDILPEVFFPVKVLHLGNGLR